MKLIIGVDKLSSKAQSIENFTNLQALNGCLCKCIVDMLNVRYEGGIVVLNKRGIMTSQSAIESPNLGWVSQYNSSNSRYS